MHVLEKYPILQLNKGINLILILLKFNIYLNSEWKLNLF